MRAKRQYRHVYRKAILHVQRGPRWGMRGLLACAFGWMIMPVAVVGPYWEMFEPTLALWAVGWLILGFVILVAASPWARRH